MSETLPFLPYGRQSITDEDIAAVVGVLRSDYLTQGPEVEHFEQALAEAAGAKYAVAYSHGTAALFGACWAAGLQSGDEVVTTPITFAASANAACYVGARPVFADIEPTSATIDPEAVLRALTPRTRALIPVHFAGQPLQLEPLREIARQKGLTIIEDAAHALGASWRGQPIGSGSDMAIFSFHPVKHVTTGEGGAVTTDDPRLADRLRRFRNHGIERDPARFTIGTPGPWYHEMQDLGHNFRLTDLQAALGRSQLARLPAFVARRREIADRYDRLFAQIQGVRPIGRGDGDGGSFHLYVVRIDFQGLGTTRAQVMNSLRQRGIGTQVHYIPVYRHPYHAQFGWNPADFPNAEAYYAEALSLPMYPALTDADVDRVAATLAEVLHAGQPNRD